MDLFRVQLGSVRLDDTPDGKVLTLVRVIHQPSSRERLVKRMGDTTLPEVIEGLQEEILEELRQEARAARERQRALTQMLDNTENRT